MNRLKTYHWVVEFLPDNCVRLACGRVKEKTRWDLSEPFGGRPAGRRCKVCHERYVDYQMKLRLPASRIKETA